MIIIHLECLKFYSYHGIHPEEKILGGEFTVDVEIKFEESVNVITDLEQSINYTDLYALVSEQMNNPTPMIETVAMRIGDAVYNQHNFIKEITVKLKKMHPPIMHLQGSVGVSWNKTY